MKTKHCIFSWREEYHKSWKGCTPLMPFLISSFSKKTSFSFHCSLPPVAPYKGGLACTDTGGTQKRMTSSSVPTSPLEISDWKFSCDTKWQIPPPLPPWPSWSTGEVSSFRLWSTDLGTYLPKHQQRWEGSIGGGGGWELEWGHVLSLRGCFLIFFQRRMKI